MRVTAVICIVCSHFVRPPVGSSFMKDFGGGTESFGEVSKNDTYIICGAFGIVSNHIPCAPIQFSLTADTKRLPTTSRYF